jgi:predicted metal-dependent phosphoesterase TrpH
MKFVDLHIHTTASDGKLAPRDVVALAKDIGLAAVAITDHDTLSGVDEFLVAGREHGIETLAGVEVNAEHSPGALHILGYFAGDSWRQLGAQLGEIRAGRKRRAELMVAKLRGLGIDIQLSELLADTGCESIGRPHFADELVKKGYARDRSDAFARYVGRGAPAYVPREKLSPRDCIRLIRDAGGIAALAHPGDLVLRPEALADLLADLKRAGLGALEVYYPSHTAPETESYLKLSRDLGLVAVGGTDFHGDPTAGITLGTGRGDLRVPYETVEELKRALAGTSSPSGRG